MKGLLFMVQAADTLNLDGLKERDDAALVPADSTQSEESDALALVIAQATAPIVASLHKALALGLVLAFAIIFAIGFCIYLYNRMPDLVLIREDQDGRRVV